MKVLPFAALGALTGFFLGLWVVNRKRRAEAVRQMERLEKQLGRMNSQVVIPSLEPRSG